MNTHQIPGDKSRIDRSFEVISDHNSDILMAIAQNPASGRVYQYYTACMNTQQIESEGLAPLSTLWSSLTNNPSDANKTLALNMAALYKNGLSGFFDLAVEIDSSDPSHNIYSLHQGGLSLPDASYYTDDTVFPAFQNHISNMFKLAGDSPSQANAEAQAVAALEAQLANITVPPDALFNPFVSFNKMDWFDFMSLMNNMPIQNLVDALSIKMDVSLTIDAVDFFKRLNALFGSGSFTQGQTMSYFRWRMLHSLANKLPQAFGEENFNFYGKILSGLSVPSPRNRTCLAATDAVMPELTGRLFAEQAFPASSKTSASIIFDSILSAFEVNVQKLDWMDPTTTQRAIDKLQKIMLMIGYPENPRNYTSYNFGNSYSKNFFLTVQDEFQRTMATAGGPSVRNAWEMSAGTVNAYYSPTTNTECVRLKACRSR
jgi:predicted metalloendopeptidase